MTVAGNLIQNPVPQTAGAAEPALRKFPFPYRAALAVCSDIDLCDRPLFVELHRFLNLDLGLPVADSFFGCAMGRKQLGFLTPGCDESADAPFIRECIRAGMIDTIHTWGDFNGTGPEPALLRKIAEKLTSVFKRDCLNVPIWVNHGAPENRQNLLFRLYNSYQGDDPASPWYTADLLPALGVRYYCSTDMVGWPLDAGSARERRLQIARCAANGMKNMVKRLLCRSRLVRPAPELTRLCNEVALRDGLRLWGFSRYHNHPRGAWTRATRETFRYSVSGPSLDALVAAQGYAVVYMHLGLPVERDNGPLFKKEDRLALEGLAARARGPLWVASTGALLRYNTLSRSLVWKAEQQGEKTVITIGSGNCHPAREECAGLTFYTERPSQTIIQRAGKELPLRQNRADETGRTSVSVPLPPAPDCACLELP